jgi:ABC-type branched-subunit amino acid transport system ATPase component
VQYPNRQLVQLVARELEEAMIELTARELEEVMVDHTLVVVAQLPDYIFVLR